MVDITRHSRQVIAPEWSVKSWTHNIFRAYEYLFGRRDGLKAEMTVDGTNNIVVCHSWEAAVAFAESYIRDLLHFKIRVPVKIWVPVLMTPQGMPVFASPYLFAIAFDVANAQANTTTSPKTYSHTVTGSNNIILIGNQNVPGTTDLNTAVTYNAVSATFLNYVTQGAGCNADLWQLTGPATGANTVSVTFTSTNLDVISASYSGAKQSGQPDATNTTTQASGTSITTTVTTVAANCWIVGRASNGSTAPTAGTGATARANNAGAGGLWIDSNGPLSAGANSLSVTGVSTGMVLNLASIAPFVTVTINSGFFRLVQ